ncbi:MAG: flagellar biosynthesis protein FlhB [Armatimonadota bacterium]|nr:flagellar biosynthesis protein FlhB [bacterium]MCS7308598.1 flagellar biosynthesis protein FlhB [Armatimonadota bacterium]MDW8105327.1 flagellar biosynthesis protein FlhB [Armatimonadota bacterium]MDW8289962.1 flagellar biosynthesis protein FlhB [Armatimonadota bacterium]
MPTEERTEQATPRRRQEARRRGQVARSVELTSVAVFLAVVLVLKSVSSGALQGAMDSLRFALTHPHLTEFSPALALAFTSSCFSYAARAFLPVIGVAMVVGIVINLLQVGVTFTAEPLAPNWARLNPIVGLSRLFSRRAAVESVKTLLKVLLIGWLTFSAVRADAAMLLRASEIDPLAVLMLVGQLLYKMAWRVGLAMLVLAVLDYGFQRWEYEKSLRMTKEEVKQEMKQTEGDPQVKSRIRARQQAIARRRMMQAVPKADVVVTNPTHYAVALQYDAQRMAAPTVVAKGMNLIALRIREIAQQHGVPIVHNPPLAQSLYRTVDVGQQIPPALYQAVAEVLAYVYQLRQRR